MRRTATSSMLGGAPANLVVVLAVPKVVKTVSNRRGRGGIVLQVPPSPSESLYKGLQTSRQ
jgi:hypothetical protein